MNRRKRVQHDVYSLPTKKSTVSERFEDYLTLFYGARKIGKSTLASHFPDTFHLMFEIGSRALEILSRNVRDWPAFLAYINLIEKGEHGFKTAVIDTGTIAYDRCLRYCSKLIGVDHPGGLKDFGKTWSKISTEFEEAHSRLGAHCGLVIITHETTKAVSRILVGENEFDPDNEETEGEEVEYEMTMPLLKKQADSFYNGLVDNIFYYHYVDQKRFLLIRGTAHIVAGTRCEKNFLTKDGRPIWKIPMGDSSEEAYDNLLAAFYNEQERSYGADEIKRKPKIRRRQTHKNLKRRS